MKTITQRDYGRGLIRNAHCRLRSPSSELILDLRAVGLAVALFGGAWSGPAQELTRPEELIDAGDYYTLADGSKVHLLQVTGEIAVKRDRGLRSETVLQAVGADAADLGERLLTTVDLGESHVVDLLRIDLGSPRTVSRVAYLPRVTAWGWYTPANPGFASANEIWVYESAR